MRVTRRIIRHFNAKNLLGLWINPTDMPVAVFRIPDIATPPNNQVARASTGIEIDGLASARPLLGHLAGLERS
jgi:hypothetical protein